MAPNNLNFEAAIDILKQDCIMSQIAFAFNLDIENKFSNAIIQRVDGILEMSFDISNIRKVIGSSSQLLFEGVNSDEYKLGESHLGNTLIDIVVNEELCAQSVCGNICAANLKEISYKLPTSDFDGTNYYKLSDSGRVIIKHLWKLSKVDDQQDVVMGMFNEIPFYVTYKREEDKDKKIKTTVYLQYDGKIQHLLLSLSFFFCTPIDYDKHLTTNEEGTTVVFEKCLQHWTPVNSRNEILGYLFSKDVCIQHLSEFLGSLPDQVNLPDNVQADINYYLRAENVDEITRLTIYSSILEKEASSYIKLNNINLKEKLNKKKIHSFDKIKYFLNKELKIDAEKINDNISSKNILNDRNEPITDFYLLRNFFTHNHGSKEAEDFLKESDILFFLKEATTILILKLLGVENVTFATYFSEISVFK